MMNPPNQPTAAAQAAQAAARLAGYSQFYGAGQPGFAPAPSMRPPPPGSFGRPPPPPHGFPRGTPPPPNMMMRPPPPRLQAANQWQWSNGQAASATTVVASAPPVRFPLPPRNHLGPPPRGFSNAGPPAKPAPGFGAAAPNGAGSALNTKWPDSLHDYVKRAFARCKGAADQALTQQALKELITNAITANNLWTRNWNVEPLPTLVGDTIPARMANAQPTPMHQPGFHKFNANSANPVANAFAAMESNKLKRKHTGGIEGAVEDVAKKNQRRQRFHKDKSELAKLVTPTVDTKKLRVLNEEGELDLDAMVIKGTCQTVEKEYLRLTSAPHPSTVRPESILKEALALVKKKWKKGKCDYIYACSQLKSIRQDCTVQHIKNDFTVLVYETHARVALESGDINEFNQCQTQLHELYEQALPGQAIEFLAYRVLYSVYVSLQAKKADSNAGVLGMYSVLSSITDKLRADPVITHALAVRAAVAQNDYHRFFRLYVNAPNMAGYLMDPMVPAIRLAALRAMCKAYRPSLSLQFIRDELKLKGKDGEEFIAKSGLAFMKGNKEVIDTKNSDIVWVLSDQSSLI